MHRRHFLTRFSLAVAGASASCRARANDAPADAGGAGARASRAPAGGGSPPAVTATTPGARAAATSSGSAAMPAPLKEIPGDAPTLRWVPAHGDLVYTFGGAAPKQRIASGTRIVSWTEDCFDGMVKTSNDLPSKVMPPGHDNPQTGPFYVEGAQPGDTVAVHLLKLEPARGYGVSSFSPGFGALVGTDRTAMLGADMPETSWRYDLNADRTAARASSRDGAHAWEIPVAPFLGCLGVAPSSGEARSTIVPGPFGGNMDCPEVRAGNTVFLGVNVPGALLSFGDGHYAMGDGEIMGAAIEGAMNVEVFVELIKRTATPVPRIENAREVMFVGTGRPLEDAARVAFKAMVAWVREHTGLRELDAYQFVSQAARAPVVQLVDPEYTVLVKIEKGRLPT
jgi:acetamidase/formamidase